LSGGKPRRVADDVYVLPHRLVNTYIVLAKREVAVVDTGLPGFALRIATAVQELGRRADEVRHVVVTHCHADHAGSAAALKRMCPADVYMHAADAALVRDGRCGRPMQADGLGAAVARPLLRRLIPTSIQPFEVEHEVTDGDELPIAGGCRVLHTPGHSAGQISLLAPDSSVVFAGDAVRSLVGLGLMPSHEDRERARESAERLSAAAKGLAIACFGHGPAVPAHRLSERAW
jgi:glyoxylase-like metal-dependent hydrolase (beta-lactamase superfamily II)